MSEGAISATGAKFSSRYHISHMHCARDDSKGGHWQVGYLREGIMYS